MKKSSLHLTAILLIFAFPAMIQAQTLHGIVFTNTKDKKIGKSATENTNNIALSIVEISQALSIPLNLQIFKGNNYTFAKLDSLLSSLRTDSNDVIIFYINSHGFKSSTKSDFPRVYIPSIFKNRYLVSTDAINSRLLDHSVHPSSILTIIQSCNRMKSKSLDLSMLKSIAPNKVDNYKKLFFSRQNIMITSSQRGQTSIATKKGSHSTLSLLQALNDETDNASPTEITWESVLQRAKKYSLKLNKKKHPVWNIKTL